MSPVRDRIVELAALRVELDGSVARMQTLVNPKTLIPASASSVHGITDEMVQSAPDFVAVGKDFLRFADGSTLVAHNARFDLGFLQESCARSGLPLWRGKTIDTIRLLKTTHSNLPSYSLQNLRQIFQLDDPFEDMRAHRAAADVEWTFQLLEIALMEALRLSGAKHHV